MTDLAPPYAFRREMVAPVSITVDDWQDERRARLAALAVARACVGVRARPEAEAALMLPHDKPSWAVDYLRGASTCALFALAVLRLLGAEHPALDQPYARRVGRAVADVLAVARASGAWREPSPLALPLPGDVVLIGHADALGRPDPAYVRGTKATEHVLLVTLAAGGQVESVDGGQPDVRPSTRTVVRVGRELWFGHTAHGTGPDGRPLVGRRCVGWLDLAALALPRESYLPVGADITG